MLIDAEQLTNYQRCHRRAYLDVHGDPAERDATNEYLLKLIQDSQENQRGFISKNSFHQPSYRPEDWQAAHEGTLNLMQQGVEQIFQGVLLVETADGVTLKSNPDLLVKQPGRSLFGDWLYAPIEIKLGKRPKMEYQIAVAFHTMVLAEVQGAWAEDAWVLLRERGRFAVDLWEILPKMQDILDDCVQMLVQRQEPEVFIARSRCSLCHWLSHCHTIAKAEQHLSLLPGVTPTRYGQLQALNLTTVRSLAEMNPAELELIPGFGREAAYKLVRQARSALHNQALLMEEEVSFANPAVAVNSRMSTTPHYLHPLHAAFDIPSATIELYFDIEAEPTLNLAYLHGVLVVDRLSNTQDFYPLIADRPEDEVQVWQQFLDLVWRYPQAPIFHFCPYEVQTVERLAKLYGTPSHLIQPLLARFVDLHDRVTRAVTLPVESYALKPIARWLGFNWRDPSANGAQSICWYSQWLSTGDRTYLDSILVYNEDDCRATHHVKDWLVGFLMESSFPAAELA
ncbi:MAG: TM0106 family RecB-like putative nuclease [Leptolyngbyaceae cyanobacterium bins.302]|nr:TM0106 family RecB-like putative nuclease [Leptolyngbyaceae cyanobacterium bins.302]